MSNFRAVLTFAVIGTLLGIVFATLAAPTILSNGLCGFSSDTQIQRPCLDTVQQATGGLIRYQLYGALAGTVVGLAAGIFFNVKRKKAPAAAPAAGPKP
ncbi:MAG: hypothetical protein H6Q89_3757 [Myxococcaceae bacterium]|nr:hypothetical protein [Myxococcaceae bacterium]